MTKVELVCPQCGRRYAEPADRCSVDGCPLYGPEVMQRLGTTIGNYKIHHILGEGGMGVVSRGGHVMLSKPVAIKILHDRFARREGAVDQFLREARAASRIRHPHIVDVTDFGSGSDGSVYFVMEYLEGESLEDVLGRDHRIDLFDSINIARQIANALAAAHDNEIVHLDLKPENVFLINQTGRRRIVRRVDGGEQPFIVEPEGKFDFVKLLDFGVARFLRDQTAGRSTRSGMVFGTPHYMSPEQARGQKVDARSDVYSLGILLYEMILGDVPFDYESASDILNAHVSSEVPPLKGQSPDVLVDDNTNETVLRCLKKSPKDRYQTMDELMVALSDCFTDRVFLRDAHKLPGAVEAGILPPSWAERQQQDGGALAATGAEASPVRRLTDELSELFHQEPDAGSLDDTTPTVESASVADLTQPKSTGAASAAAGPGRVRRPTSRGVGQPTETDASSTERKRRITETMVSKSKESRTENSS